MIAKTVFFIEDSAPAIELTNIVLAAFQKIVNDGAKPSPGCSSHRSRALRLWTCCQGGIGFTRTTLLS